MNLFETIKAAAPVRQAAEHYGLKVSRNGMACCPFHNDRHPSLKLNEEYFFCFGCGAKGDVIDFAARLFDLSSYEAAQIAVFLEEYIPDVAAMETQMKKYHRCFTTAESEKKALKKKNDDLTEALEKSQQQSTVKKLQEARLQSDYERVKGILDRMQT